MNLGFHGQVFVYGRKLKVLTECHWKSPEISGEWLRMAPAKRRVPTAESSQRVARFPSRKRVQLVRSSGTHNVSRRTTRGLSARPASGSPQAIGFPGNPRRFTEMLLRSD